ncbi:MAG TPA: ATP synthase F1 subunit gamma [bacterium]|nr:ATP synthase F1 subunit gamma [bacterium]
MATLKTIRKRIASVKNTQKITKAMKMVAAAKLRRAQTRLISARPYSGKMNELLANMVKLIGPKAHSIFQPRNEVKSAEFLVLTSDRGLCGGFNGNLLRRVENFLKDQQTKIPEIRVTVVGKKGRDFFRSRKREPQNIITGIQDNYPFDEAMKIAEDMLGGFQEGRFDEFYLVYNYFRSAISQEIRIERILPLSVGTAKAESAPEKLGDRSGDRYVPEYIYEPSRAAILDKLVPRAVATVIHRAFLESIAGEFGARMMAMENATNNSKEMIGSLTLQMNRLRQAVITTELMDIVNGAESLKK